MAIPETPQSFRGLSSGEAIASIAGLAATSYLYFGPENNLYGLDDVYIRSSNEQVLQNDIAGYQKAESILAFLPAPVKKSADHAISQDINLAQTELTAMIHQPQNDLAGLEWGSTAFGSATAVSLLGAFAVNRLRRHFFNRRQHKNASRTSTPAMSRGIIDIAGAN